MNVVARPTTSAPMVLTLDFDGPVPVYLQIYQQLADAVAAGRLPEGATLPSTRQMARDLGLNYHTVHRAYDLLLTGGIIAMEARRKAVIMPAGSRAPTAEWLIQWTNRVRVLIAEARAVGMTRADLRHRLEELLDG
jgi:GntR family transcriptional regulator